MNKRKKKKNVKKWLFEHCYGEFPRYGYMNDYQCPKCGFNFIDYDEDLTKGKITSYRDNPYYGGVEWTVTYICPCCHTVHSFDDASE